MTVDLKSTLRKTPRLIVEGRLVAPIAGTLCSRWKPKMMMLAGVIILALAMIGCSLSSQLWHFYVCFGVISPVGTALCGWPIISPALMNWFATQRGLVMGIGQSGSGLSFVFGLLTQYLILCLGWRSAYLALAVILITVLLPLHHLIFHYRPENKGLTAYGSNDLKSDKVVEDIVISRNWTVSQILHTYQLWLLALSFFLFWGISIFLELIRK